MAVTAGTWALILACYTVALAVGGGLYENLLVSPVWSKTPPKTFALIQPEHGLNLVLFWIPVHAAITLLLITALVTNWHHKTRQRLLLIAVASYVVMRLWTLLYFVPEILYFESLSVDGPSSEELARRASTWHLFSWFREPLMAICQLAIMLALATHPDTAGQQEDKTD